MSDGYRLKLSRLEERVRWRAIEKMKRKEERDRIADSIKCSNMCFMFRTVLNSLCCLSIPSVCVCVCVCVCVRAPAAVSECRSLGPLVPLLPIVCVISLTSGSATAALLTLNRPHPAG